MPRAKTSEGFEINTSTLAKRFSDEAAAWALVEYLRWPDGEPICPHCGAKGDATYLAPKNGNRTTSTGKVTYRRVWKCGACAEQFSALVGTVMEDSKIPLSKWLLAMHLLCSGKNGVSAHELHRQLGITYKSAWFMAHRIRYAMAPEAYDEQLQGTVEADETYIGGRVRRASGDPLTNKTPVVTLIARGGEARSQVMQTVTRDNIGATLREHADPQAVLMTDENAVYVIPGKAFAGHETVNHSAGEYVRGDAHINTAEGFFSQLKRSIDGTYHHVSAYHLHRYLAEFDYRYNLRKVTDGERTATAMHQVAGKRLMYRDSFESAKHIAGA